VVLYMAPENAVFLETAKLISELCYLTNTWDAVDISRLKRVVGRLTLYLTTQFVTPKNRSKTHTLMHISESIERFGPCPVYYVETFESLNKCKFCRN
jgi:hypothetical protein